MVNISERIEQYVVDASMGFIDAGVAVQDKLAPVGNWLIDDKNIPVRWLNFLARAMDDLYRLEGLEKWSKALGADLKFADYFCGGMFKEATRAAEDQKNLYYATLIIGSMCDFIKKHEDGTFGLQMPTMQVKNADGDLEDRIDWVKFFYAFGNFFETAKFCQKYNVFDMSYFTHLSNTYGAVKVFDVRLDDVKVIGTVFDKPKDLFVFIASLCDNYNSYHKGLFNKDGSVKWDIVLKVTSSTGKMFLIWFGKYNYNKPWFMVADVITQNASLFSLIYKREKERNDRFAHPELY